MTQAKTGMLKRGLSIVLSAAMILSMGAFTAFAQVSAAADDEVTGYPVTELKAPVEDGVYYADINLKNANSTGQDSMGNAALRGSTSFLTKNPDDTSYKPLLVVKDGKATAIVEFMPMGYIGMYGFMMELEAVRSQRLTRYGSPDEAYSQYIPAGVLAQHRTTSGEIVYDSYNDPNSEYVFDGSNPAQHTRPAGFGHEARLVNIENVPYSHILTLDVTPISIGDAEAPATGADFDVKNAAFVHVFVPVMFSISPSSGDQYARLQVDWTSLKKVENPSDNAQYQLYLAKQIQKGNYTDASYQALQDAVTQVQNTLANIWPSQKLTMNGSGFQASPLLNQKEFTAQEQQEMSKKLKDAIDQLEEKGDKSALNDLLDQAQAKQEADYTPDSWTGFAAQLKAAQAVQQDEDASVSDVTAAVNELTQAMDALVARADTADLEQLIRKAQDQENIGYTAESWKALQDAVAAAEKTAGDPNASQSEVNAQVTALQKALDGLVEDGELHKEHLKDGVYSVYGEMIKMNRTDKSMSNDAISHNIKLTVENGQYYLTMDFKGLSYLNRFGYLAELSYYVDGYTFGPYGAIVGSRSIAQVLTTQKNADGSDVTDEFNLPGGSYEGRLYPDQIRFPLVSDALADPDGYVPLHVFVPVMEDISDGTGDQDVLLKLDWSTLKVATDEDFTPDEPEAQSPAVDVTDPQTGVQVQAEAGVLPENARLEVVAITSGSAYQNAAAALRDAGKKFRLYEVRFVDEAGQTIEPNGAVTIRYPIPEGYDAQQAALYRINEDGSKTLVKGTAADGYYTFVTKSFGQYALVEKGSTQAEKTDTPATGDSMMMGAWLPLMAASAGMIGLSAVLKKRKVK